jgi:hypothetical protein
MRSDALAALATRRSGPFPGRRHGRGVAEREASRSSNGATYVVIE